MAKRRSLYKSISTSEKLTRVYKTRLKREEKDPCFALLLYSWIIPHLDDFGRYAGDSFSILYNVVPTLGKTENDVERALNDLYDKFLYIPYEIDGRKYLFQPEFEKMQDGLHRRTVSRYPEPPKELLMKYKTAVPGTSDNLQEIPKNSGNFQEIPSEGKGREEKRNEEKKNKRTLKITKFDEMIAEKWCARAKQHFKTVKIDKSIFAEDISKLKTIDKLTKDQIIEITDYLAKRPDVGNDFCWFDQIGTPGKLRQRSKKADKRKYWDYILKEIERSKPDKFFSSSLKWIKDESKFFGPCRKNDHGGYYEYYKINGEKKIVCDKCGGAFQQPKTTPVSDEEKAKLQNFEIKGG